MTTITTSIAAVDAIQRIPLECWRGPYDDPNGYPNYPVWVDTAGAPVDTLDDATHALWDGAFGALTARLIAAIGADPTRIPADTTTLDRAALLELYPAVAIEPNQVTP